MRVNKKQIENNLFNNIYGNNFFKKAKREYRKSITERALEKNYNSSQNHDNNEINYIRELTRNKEEKFYFINYFDTEKLEIQNTQNFYIHNTPRKPVVSKNAGNSNNPNNLSNKILRILVVDDEKLIRQSSLNILRKYLNKMKIEYEIEECCDGIECIYKIYQGYSKGILYDFIITDETMNFFNGSYMARIIKNLIKENIIDDIKIFMVTSYEWEIIYKKNSDILEKVYTKPLSINILENIFDNI